MVSARLWIASEKRLHDQDIKNQINLSTVIIPFQIIADKTAINQELDWVQSTDIRGD